MNRLIAIFLLLLSTYSSSEVLSSKVDLILFNFRHAPITAYMEITNIANEEKLHGNIRINAKVIEQFKGKLKGNICYFVSIDHSEVKSDSALNTYESVGHKYLVSLYKNQHDECYRTETAFRVEVNTSELEVVRKQRVRSKKLTSRSSLAHYVRWTVL